jgi:hypothetical protein
MHRFVTIILIAAGVVTASSSGASTAGETVRQTQVERNGASVMPFSMDATMHHFVPTPVGGVQTVLVHNGDGRQVALVRGHLRKEAAAFAEGVFTDPASIHGGGMPGLKAMRAGSRRIAIGYADVPNGGKITYSTRDHALVAAIHTWFEAQVADHGAHATMKM